MHTPPAIPLKLFTENQLIEAGADSQRALEIRLTAPPSAAPGKRQALNISLVLDRSGSMSGEKLRCVKQAAAHVLDLLGENDRVSVVTYDDQVDVVAASAFLTPAFKSKVKHLIQKVASGGMTNLFDGWLTGCKQVAENLSSQGGQVDRALLLTDGLANVGITDAEELAFHARKVSELGVSTSTFGVGEGFDEALLEAMANNGGGNFTYIISPMDIPEIFAREFNELIAISARDVEVNLTIPTQVDMTILGNWRSESTGPGATRVMLGSLCESQEKNLYCDLHFPLGSEGEQVSIVVTVRGLNGSGEILESQAQITFTYASAQAVQAAGSDEAFLERAALARVSEVARRSLEMERKGEAAPAASMLNDAISTNSNHLDGDARRTYERMAQRMKNGMAESDRKQMHYQSYLHRRQRSDLHFQSHFDLPGSASSDLLRQLLQDHSVRIQPDGSLWEAPDALPATFTFDRVEGMLLGLAIGDSLGNTTEGMLPAERRAAAGEVVDYLPRKQAGGQAVGLPSDETQMAFWTVEVLLREGRLDPDSLARRLTQEMISGVSPTVLEFIRSYKDHGLNWIESSSQSAGNGAVTRIAPVLLPYLRQPAPGLWADAVLAGMLTHNDYASNAACAALAGILWELLGMGSTPPREWWAETYYRLAAPLEGKTVYTARMTSLTYSGPVAGFVRHEVGNALHLNWSTLQAGETWGSGGYLLETLPAALYILACYAGDPEQAIIRAVNDTKDNDSVAAIVGAAVGALHGKAALPQRWITGLLGRTNNHNDGHIFRLIEEAKNRFG